MVLGKQTKINVNPSKVEVGEIDTSSPFESVKHAVSLFGAVAFTRRRSQPFRKKPSSETVSARESRLHLAKKELNKLKENLHKTDMTRSVAQAELIKTKKIIEELNRELSVVVNKSNEVMLIETVKENNHVKDVKERNSGSRYDGIPSSSEWGMDTFGIQYLAAVLELNAAKQELGKLRLDCDSASRGYNSAQRQSSEAEAVSKANKKASIELSGKILGMKEMIEQAKLASEQAEEETTRTSASREILGQEYQIKLAALAETLENLKKETDPETTKKLQKQLEWISDQSEALKHEVYKAKDSYSELARMLALELRNAKETLHSLIDEDCSLRRLIDYLKMELVNIKELHKKEIEAKHLAEELKVELQKSKSELEKCVMEESRVKNTDKEMMATLVDLLNETQRARQEAKDVTLETEALMAETKANRYLIKEYEGKLQLLLQKVEAARSAEVDALERIKPLSERKNSIAKMTLSKEEFNSLSAKVKDSATISDLEVSDTMVQVEAVKARENNYRNMLEERQKELKELKLATAEALEIAEGGKNKLEGGLERLPQCLHNKPGTVPDLKTDCEIEMEPLPYPDGIGRSYSTRSANRRRMTLRDVLKLDMEEERRPKDH